MLHGFEPIDLSTKLDSTTTGSANENVSTTDVADSADGPTAPISTTVGVLIGVMLAIVVFSVCSLYIVCIYIVCVRQKIGQKELQAVQHSMTAVGIELRGDPLNEQNVSFMYSLVSRPLPPFQFNVYSVQH